MATVNPMPGVAPVLPEAVVVSPVGATLSPLPPAASPAPGPGPRAVPDVDVVTPEPVASGEPAEVTVAPMEALASVIVLAVWLALLAGGLTVSTQPYIELLRNRAAGSVWEVGWASALILFCHTATNTAMLCCLSASLGVIGSRAIAPGAQPGARDHETLSVYVAATTRGFFVYLIIQSGFVTFSDTPFTAVNLEQYVRMAALASLVSFTVGYNPGLFRRLLARVDSLTSGQEPEPHGPGGGRNGDPTSV